MGVVAALLALDGTQVLVGIFAAIPLTVAAVGTVISAWNSRAAKKELRPNGGSSTYDRISARLDAQDDDLADMKRAIADVAQTVGFVMHEMAAEKVRAQFAEAELSARLDNEKRH